ncbi:MAG: cell division protein FtsZ [Gammaproteobacteria bacterium]|nr:cell division protein FtsZ [Gammaproteobacteria bacterium]MDD9884667.1 cell division protein FtsZ [Gammaproteobacteria bacterium]
MLEFQETPCKQAVIKVIGVGGGGGNAVEHMVDAELDGVGVINANTDAQALTRSGAATVLQIGEGLTKGLGAGANPDIGRQAAVEDRERIAESIKGADMVFIAAGMGGGTGTGATPVIAELAREMKMLAVAVVTRPFPFEGPKRMQVAHEGIRELQAHVDSLIVIPNEKVLAVMGQSATMVEAFHEADKVLFNAVQGISELITRPGFINVDFADVRTVMSEMGMAMMGSAVASGENRAAEAAKLAISSPLLEDVDLHGARGMLVNITASKEMTIGEYEAVGTAVGEFAAGDANVVIGTALDAGMQEQLRVTMVATGLADPKAQRSGGGNAQSPANSHLRPVPQPRRLPPQRAATSAAEALGLNAQDYDLPPFLRRQAD